MYVLDKVFLYLLVYCSPYVLSYFALSNVFKKLSFLGPALVVYVAYSSYLFFNDMYFARGAEVDPKPLYFILLYAPPLLVVLGILIAKRKAAEPSRPAS